MPSSPPPLVTVVVTVYRRLDFLPEALRGLEAQTFRDFEVILKDDSGADFAREIAMSFETALALRYLPNAKTLGIAASIRAGLEEARGTYVAILNDDDFWQPDFLAKLVPALEEKSSRVVAFCDHWIVDGQGAIRIPQTDANSLLYGRTGRDEGELLETHAFAVRDNGVPLAMGALFRRDALPPARLVDQVSGAYDYWISCLLAATEGAFYYVPQRLTCYRVHEQMETARRSPDKSENNVYIYQELLDRNYFPELHSFLRNRLAGALFRLGRDRLYFNQTGESRRLFRQVMAVNLDWRPVVGWVLTLAPRWFRIRLHLTEEPSSLQL